MRPLKERRKEYYQKNKEAIKKKVREYYAKNRLEIINKRKKYHKKRYLNSREEVTKYYRERNKERRIELIKAMGGKCVWCGYTDWRALQIDRVNGDGVEDRKITKNFSKKQIIERFKNYPEKYQLLCSNCNWIKRYENREVRRYA